MMPKHSFEDRLHVTVIWRSMGCSWAQFIESQKYFNSTHPGHAYEPIVKKLCKATIIIDLVFSIHTMEEAGLFHGEILPSNGYIGIDNWNYHLHNFHCLAIDEEYSQEAADLSPMYKEEFPRTISLDKEIRAVGMNIAQALLPD
jgi:hypothetical protein